MKKQRRKFSQEFKLKVVLEALQERSTLNELGENTNFIPIRYRPGSRISSTRLNRSSLPRRQTRPSAKWKLKKQNCMLNSASSKWRWSSLKKAVSIDRKKRIEMVDKNSKLSQRRQCELLCIHRSGLYYKPKGESILNLHLMRIIDRQYTATPFYGVPRMWNFINQAYGYKISKNRVERLYKLMDIRAIGPNPYTSKPGNTTYKFPYLLRNLAITRPNQVWAADITFMAMAKGYMFLFALIDLYSRHIVNWSISNSMTAQWCVAVIKEALLLNGKLEILNTDQGSQFTSEDYVDLLKEECIQISMDGKGRAINNIFIERFWRSYKYEYLSLTFRMEVRSCMMKQKNT